MRQCSVVLVVASLLASVTPAYADYQADANAAAQIGVGVLDRTRRGIAIGPHAGGYVGTSLDPSQAVGGVTFGLALYTFELPTVFDLQELIQERVKIAAQNEAKRIIAEGGQPDMEAIGRKLYEDIKAEIMGEEIKPRTLERPKRGVILEGVIQTTPVNGYGARLSVTQGLKLVSLGLAVTYLRSNGSNLVYLGPDVSLRLTPIGRSRTPVFDLYVRADYGFGDPFLITLGGRALLDLF
jgi:hypothetical protein